MSDANEMRAIYIVRALLVVATGLLLVIAVLSLTTATAVQRNEDLADQTVVELRAMNVFWHELAEEQRQINTARAARRDSTSQR